MENTNSHQVYVSCCSVCKRIKGNDGQWHTMPNAYMQEIEKKLTHGYCEFCFKEFLERI